MIDKDITEQFYIVSSGSERQGSVYVVSRALGLQDQSPPEIDEN